MTCPCQNFQDKESEVTIKYYYPTHKDEIWMHTHAQDMYALLRDIDDKCRSVVKYEDSSEDRVKLAEDIRELIHENVNLDKVS